MIKLLPKCIKPNHNEFFHVILVIVSINARDKVIGKYPVIFINLNVKKEYKEIPIGTQIRANNVIISTSP